MMMSDTLCIVIFQCSTRGSLTVNCAVHVVMIKYHFEVKETFRNLIDFWHN